MRGDLCDPPSTHHDLEECPTRQLVIGRLADHACNMLITEASDIGVVS